MIILALIGVPALPLALLGAGFGIVGGLVSASILRWNHANLSKHQVVPPELATNTELVRVYHILREALFTVASGPDGIPKETLTQKIVALGVQLRAMATGTNTFAGSGSWYVAHDAVLAVPDLREYLAVVRVRDPECVRDPVIQESLRATFAAVNRGVLVERVLVISDTLWPGDRVLPTDDVRPWIEDQHNHGLRVILLRERDLPTDTSGPIDTCVFDDWGVGTRDLDDRSQTVRVALDFAPGAVRAARERLDRLSQIGIPFGELLERAERSR
ncbi:Membrane protein OS=Rhodopirellula europaea 6C GN=RE6C_02843 PE=4 SV=1 [Gemmata massiliana]|uniref:Membrane protein n=1 Tax=Gemmata massiliana TaxID=1210884 RepID=A0A6P2CWW9_9BACT|nr:Membrane protein OS=Rhodopirellula europaea 6C GN=RE6C_02843 PE=4 SV=1 [Gemmata massiliana]